MAETLEGRGMLLTFDGYHLYYVLSILPLIVEVKVKSCVKTAIQTDFLLF